jgi:hypothetical protein
MKYKLLYFVILTMAQVNSYSQESDDPLNWDAPIKLVTNDFFLLWSEGADPDSLQSYQKVYNFNFDSLEAPITNRIDEFTKHSSDVPVMGNGKMSVVSGNLNNDAFDDVIAIWETSEHMIEVLVPHFDTTINVWNYETSFTISGPVIAGKSEKGRIFIRKGNFDNDEMDEFVIAFLDNAYQIHLEVYDSDGTLVPTLKASLTDEDLSANPAGQIRFSITTGDFNNDGIDEIAIASYNSNTGTATEQGLFAKIYQVSGSSIVPKVSEIIFEKPDFPIYDIDLCIKAYPQYSLGTDVLAVAFNFIDFENADDYIDNTFLQLVEVKADLSGFTMDISKRNALEKQYDNAIWNLLLESGDLDDDGKEELVFVIGNSMNVYTPDDQLNLASKCSGAVPNVGEEGAEYTYGYEFLALDNVDQYEGDEIIVVRNIFNPEWDAEDDQYFHLQIYGTQGDSAHCPTIARYTDEEVPFDWPKRNYALTVGNFDASTVTIHKPVYRRLSEIAQPVVILNAPPIHFDIFDSLVYDINHCFEGEPCDFVATYVKEENDTKLVSTTVQATLDVAVGVESNSTVGAEVSAEPGGIGVAASYSQDFEFHLFGKYGEHLESTNTKIESNSITVAVNAREDDMVYSTITDYDSWEYPYSKGDSKEYSGSIWAIIPVHVEGRWFPSKSISGLNYRPNHEVGNILSYYEYDQTTDPPNLEQYVGADNNTITSTLSATGDLRWKLNRTHFEENSADSLIEYGIDFKLSAFAYAEVVSNNAYAYTYKTSVGESLDISVYMGFIDRAYGPTEYRVTPYAYWSKQGALIIDYSVEPEVDVQGSKTWWQEKYGDYSDPTLILPWRLDPEKGYGIYEEAKRQQTKDIVLDPLIPGFGDTVLVTATIRNFSLKNTPGSVKANFYIGDPNEGGTLISDINGATEFQTDGIVKARSLKTIEFQWDYPDNLGKFTRIYVVLDPENSIEEIHENNNIGWVVVGAPQSITNIESPLAESKKQTSILQQNYPNPFSDLSNIEYILSVGSKITLSIYDVSGMLLKSYSEGYMEPGLHSIEIDGYLFETGIYFYTIQGSFATETRKMIIIQ